MKANTYIERVIGCVVMQKVVEHFEKDAFANNA